ncbi:MAG: hypothetical protein EOP60_07365 [Sphingomonadales bacterium]|nr:MAG: hypothetical protein EOP60_07365 [Sphingomonadales bacterium]
MMLETLLLFAPVIAPVQDRCPHVALRSSTQPGGRIAFTGMVHGGDTNVRPTYNWAVSAGTVASGQGTPEIQIEAEPGLSVTATLDVGGFDLSCATSASETELAMPAAAPDCPLLMVVSSSPSRGKGEFGAQIFRARRDQMELAHFRRQDRARAGHQPDRGGSRIGPHRDRHRHGERRARRMPAERKAGPADPVTGKDGTLTIPDNHARLLGRGLRAGVCRPTDAMKHL